jgi:peptidyl-prolyl cis-trans isomerase C
MLSPKQLLTALALLGTGLTMGYLLGSRARSSAETTATPALTVVARFKDGVITADALRARMGEEGPLMAERYSSREGKRALLQSMVREQVLLAEARQKGYDRNAGVARQCEAALMEAFLNREFEQPERQKPVTSAELEAYFQQRREQLARPAQVRLAQILLVASTGETARREQQRRAAHTLLAQLKTALARDRDAFTTLARQRSEDPRSRPLGGELPPLTEEQAKEFLGTNVVASLFGEEGHLGLYDGVIESPDGFRLVTVLAREQKVVPDFEKMRGMLEPMYARERRNEHYAAFVAAIEQRAQVHIDDAALDDVSAVSSSATTSR